MTQVHVKQGEGMCVRRVSLHLGRKTTVRVGPRTYAYVMCWNVGLLAARRVNRGSRSRPIRLRHETIALFQNKNKRPQSLPDESGPLTINRSSMFVLILSRQKPFSIHITIQVKVILAVMKQLKELETEPRKNSEARTLLTCFQRGFSWGFKSHWSLRIFLGFRCSGFTCSITARITCAKRAIWWGRLRRGVKRRAVSP